MVYHIDGVPNNLLSNLESRDAALWIRSLPKDPPSQEALVAFLGLPWRLVLSEKYDPEVVKVLSAAASLNDPATRKRGFIQIVDSNPSQIELPARCLPFYLLNGRENGVSAHDFNSQLRRMTMLDALRRSGVRDLLVISGDEDPIPVELKNLWSSGFRSHLTFISESTCAEKNLLNWTQEPEGIGSANLFDKPPSQVIEEILRSYFGTYPEDRRIIRLRDRKGKHHKIDVTEADVPDRPILELYSIIEARDISPLMPEELTEEEFVTFFQNPVDSWRPYAAGLPWIREDRSKKILSNCMKKLDNVGVEENCIAYISSESGAGGTTLARALSWEFATEGYPVLLAKPLPFVPNALTITNYLTRVHREAENQMASELEQAAESDGELVQERKHESAAHRYKTPWIIVFDSLHWQSRDSELIHFHNEIVKSGRPVCILVVTGTVLGLSFYKTSIFKRVAELNHALDQNDARQLGLHLNRFLRVYGKQRQAYQWDNFYQNHTVRYLDGIAAFWVTLSFWIQGQYDLSESIQDWMFRKFKENVNDSTMQTAIFEIAALSSERLPLPEILLPESKSEWPISYLLEDNRSDLSALGLVRISANGEKYWALVHDILGRFLINALFYDFQMREELGFSDAKDAEHLRFMLLRQISKNPVLGERAYRSIGEDFATIIFKVDPDHGRGSFTPFWRDVLSALDNMPQSLRESSRLFLHHTAVSRRRIANLNGSLYGIDKADQINLLNKAIDDLNYALTFIDNKSDSEPNVNLYNSLANAYFDLAKVETAKGSPSERIIELRQLANDATGKAYAENPTSPFVIETYVKNLLAAADLDSSERAIDHCTEALGILFSVITSNDGEYRNSKLGNLADKALEILLRQAPLDSQNTEPTKAIDVLIQAWKILAEGRDYQSEMIFSGVPESNRERALNALAHQAGRGNMQVIRLSYDLICLSHPHNFKKQLEFVEQLQAKDYRMTPQLRLEYAILLYQNSRADEGDRIFRILRSIWRKGEDFVQVPARLRWLLVFDGSDVQIVNAVTGSDSGNKAMARVQEFNNVQVPFRPEEFSIREPKPGFPLVCIVSFGHNGAFLRPVTARPHKID
jgi:hypothetical protein